MMDFELATPDLPKRYLLRSCGHLMSTEMVRMGWVFVEHCLVRYIHLHLANLFEVI